jgi:hypothetical protein
MPAAAVRQVAVAESGAPGGLVFFAASDNLHGREPWAAMIDSAATP